MELHQGRENNLNLIRALAAAAVVVSHSFALATGDRMMEPFRRMAGTSMGEIAVDVFFVVSGYLISKSAMERSWADYAKARLLRIYPGLLVMLAIMFVVTMAVSRIPAGEFARSPDTAWYFGSNAILFLGILFTLPGVFEWNPVPSAVNGSLWTLVCEVRLYLFLGLATYAMRAVGAGARGFRAASLAFLIGATVAAVYYFGKGAPELYGRLTMMFAAGSFLFHWRTPLGNQNAVAACFLLVAAGLVLGPSTRFVYLAGLPYLVMSLAFLPSSVGRRYNRVGDYSYGIYIYSFLIQQLIAYALPGISAVGMLALSLPASVLAGVASWHLIEKPAMGWRRRPTVTLEPQGANLSP
jgi:peptidoglycan/LPS O-acetylase OafA/YrhL